MQEILGCSNPASDYSVGNNLFEKKQWDYKLADKMRFRGDVLEAVSEQNARYFLE